jgi:2-polyprenyl-3-methyl-5-hydroxy-6-metoxy-1,4-benzoquinol methylase
MSDYSDYGFNSSPPTSAPYLEEKVLKQLSGKNKVVLDLGCGNGWLTRAMMENGFDAYGIDVSPSGIKVAKEKHPEQFFLQDLRTKSLPAELDHIIFDTIVSTEVIEHLYDPLDFIKFCSKILKKNGGGELILSTPYHGYIKNLVISLIGGWDHHFMALYKGEHIKFWSRDSLTLALKHGGFEVSSFSGAGRVPFLWKSMVIKATL